MERWSSIHRQLGGLINVFHYVIENLLRCETGTTGG